MTYRILFGVNWGGSWKRCGWMIIVMTVASPRREKKQTIIANITWKHTKGFASHALKKSREPYRSSHYIVGSCISHIDAKTNLRVEEVDQWATQWNEVGIADVWGQFSPSMDAHKELIHLSQKKMGTISRKNIGAKELSAWDSNTDAQKRTVRSEKIHSGWELSLDARIFGKAWTEDRFIDSGCGSFCFGYNFRRKQFARKPNFTCNWDIAEFFAWLNRLLQGCIRGNRSGITLSEVKFQRQLEKT